MSLYSVLRAVVHTMPNTKFLWGTEKELDTIFQDFSAYPVICFISPHVSEPIMQHSGGINRNYECTLQFLNIGDTYGNNYRAPNEDARTGGFNNDLLILESQRAQINLFLIALRKYTYPSLITDPNYVANLIGAQYFKTVVNKPFKETPIYNKYADNLFGVSLKVKIETIYDDSFC